MSRVNDDNPQAWVIGIDKSESWHYPSYQIPSKEPDYKKLYLRKAKDYAMLEALARRLLERIPDLPKESIKVVEDFIEKLGK